MATYTELIKGEEHLRNVISMSDEFESRKELNAETFYPIIPLLVEHDAFPVENVRHLPKETIMMREAPGQGIKKVEAYVDSHWAYLVED